jgi:hypothetical protein
VVEDSDLVFQAAIACVSEEEGSKAEKAGFNEEKQWSKLDGHRQK